MTWVRNKDGLLAVLAKVQFSLARGHVLTMLHITPDHLDRRSPAHAQCPPPPGIAVVEGGWGSAETPALTRKADPF